MVTKYTKLDSKTFFRTEKEIEDYHRYSERMRIKNAAFEGTLGWLNKLGPVGKFYHTFYYLIFFEGPRGIKDGLSFSYFGDVLFWGKPIAEGAFAKYVGNRKNKNYWKGL